MKRDLLHLLRAYSRFGYISSLSDPKHGAFRIGS